MLEGGLDGQLENTEMENGNGNGNSWADSNTLLLIYRTCIKPHLEYACQLWGPFLNKGMQSLEPVQKFACKVRLKQWDMDYDSMLQLLNLPSLSVCRKYLKLTTMYNIVSGHMDFPSSIFVHVNQQHRRAQSTRSVKYTKKHAAGHEKLIWNK